ncbi:uncharacterized protein LOC124165896 [Ischnura elegans]|uniref:uncharacterized protein LOC124165896 n=1 Tax=Ischnura elegans TaxID=197161 RepID=UPI001ED8975E|nr:uncharacterized protein LOC124165896 [Ischnura elegans]
MWADGAGSGSVDGGGKRRWSSPLKVAQCRARCLQRFSGGPSRDAVCMQGPDCFMCWENCELLQSNYAVWGAMCTQKGICFPGCQQACKFHREQDTSKGGSNRQMEPVVHTQGHQVVQMVIPEINEGDNIPLPLVRWPPYRGPARSRKDNVVYVLMTRQMGAKSWTQVTQTVDLEARLVNTALSVKHLDIRVMVVDPEGLVTIYSPAETEEGPRISFKEGPPSLSTTTPGPSTPTSLPAAGAGMQKQRNWPLVIREDVTSPLDDAQLALLFPTASAEQVAAAIAQQQQPLKPPSPSGGPLSDRWMLREVSLIHQGVLVIAEVSWEERRGARVYLVTWEVDGGGLKGNLFTHTTSVTLSLWPLTLYHIQVEVVSHILGDSQPPDRSEVMHLDTRKANPVVFTSDTRHQQAPAPLSGEREKGSDWGAGKEVLVGSAAALTAFVLLFAIVIGFAGVWRRRGRPCGEVPWPADKSTAFEGDDGSGKGRLLESNASLSFVRSLSEALARVRRKEWRSWATPGLSAGLPSGITTVSGHPEAGDPHQWPPHPDAFLWEAERRARIEVQV